MFKITISLAEWTQLYFCFQNTFYEQSDGEAPSLRDGMGRVAYEQSGETFFLPFALEDIDCNQPILTGDQVEFNISTDEKYEIYSFSFEKLICSRPFSKFSHINLEVVINCFKYAIVV